MGAVVAKCPVCHGDGMVLNKQGEAFEDCECKRRAQHVDLLGSARIPKRYRAYTLGTFQIGKDRERKVSEEERKKYPCLQPGYLEKISGQLISYPTAVAGQAFKQFGDRPGILLQGPPRTGKTHLAVGILQRVIELGVSGVFVDYIEMINAVAAQRTQGFADPDRQSGQIDDYFRDADFVVIDNAGEYTPRDWVDDTTRRIVEHRYKENLPLVVTTSLNLSRSPETMNDQYLETRIGYRAYERLMAMCTLVRL